MFEASKESYEKQIKVINESHEQELKKQEELLKELDIKLDLEGHLHLYLEYQVLV